MGSAKKPEPVKLFFAVTRPAGFAVGPIINNLVREYGPQECSVDAIPFSSFTDYYENEMGKELVKSYHVFATPIERETLSAIKNRSNDIEQVHAQNGNRVINLDPGYLSRDKLVLASTKDFYHRIYIGEGIFAETTLHYRKGCYRFFSWTYPDYKAPEVQAMLEKARASLVGALRKSAPSPGPTEG